MCYTVFWSERKITDPRGLKGLKWYSGTLFFYSVLRQNNIGLKHYQAIPPELQMTLHYVLIIQITTTLQFI